MGVNNGVGQDGRVLRNLDWVTLMQIVPRFSKIPLRFQQITSFRAKNSFCLLEKGPLPRWTPLLDSNQAFWSVSAFPQNSSQIYACGSWPGHTALSHFFMYQMHVVLVAVGASTAAVCINFTSLSPPYFWPRFCFTTTILAIRAHCQQPVRTESELFSPQSVSVCQQDDSQNMGGFSWNLGNGYAMDQTRDNEIFGNDPKHYCGCFIVFI